MASWGDRAADLNVVLAAATQKGLPNTLVLRRGRGKIIFLLHCFANLSTLSVECIDGLSTIALDALGGFRGGVPVAVQSIKNLVLSFDKTEGGFRTVDIVPFFALPALTEILVWSFKGEEWEEDFFPEVNHWLDEDEVAYRTSVGLEVSPAACDPTASEVSYLVQQHASYPSPEFCYNSCLL